MLIFHVRLYHRTHFATILYLLAFPCDSSSANAGPCIGMDTACSSSLVATHLAHRGLLNGETSAAIAAGVNMILVASTSTNLAALGALSSNGRSKTFEATADGYGRGEGCVAVAMRCATAESSGCHAILQGGGTSLAIKFFVIKSSKLCGTHAIRLRLLGERSI